MAFYIFFFLKVEKIGYIPLMIFWSEIVSVIQRGALKTNCTQNWGKGLPTATISQEKEEIGLHLFPYLLYSAIHQSKYSVVAGNLLSLQESCLHYCSEPVFKTGGPKVVPCTTFALPYTGLQCKQWTTLVGVWGIGLL